MSDKHDTDAQSAQPSASGQPPVYPPIDPRLIASMYGMVREDGVDLYEYWSVIWKGKWTVVAIAFVAAVIAVAITLLMPNIYRAKVLLAPVSSEGAGQVGRVVSSLGGLASLAGIGQGSTDNTEQNLAVLQTRAFLWGFIKDNNLMPIIFSNSWNAKKASWTQTDPKKQPSLWDAYRALKGMLYISTDKDSGLVTVAVDSTDPVQAAHWANDLVERLNDYLRRKAILRSEANLKYLNEELNRTSLADVRQALYTLIAQAQKKAMIANAQKQFAFHVLDPAVPPDKKFKPKRKKIVIIATLAGVFFGVLCAFVQEGIIRRRTAAVSSVE